MKFRKKPIIIEAFRLGFDDWPSWFTYLQIFNDEDPFYLNIETLEGTMKAYHGDYIIKGIKDEIYPCKSDIFLASYEAVE